jgi:Transketolase-like TK C-terminal domain
MTCSDTLINIDLIATFDRRAPLTYARRPGPSHLEQSLPAASSTNAALCASKAIGSASFGATNDSWQIDKLPAASELVEAWKVIMQLHHEPAALILSRQALPTLDRSRYAPASGLARGAYVLADSGDGRPDVLLLGSGSEVSLRVSAYEQLEAEGVKSHVVSMPSWELFEHQSQEYQDDVIPPDVQARVSVEQASTFGWYRYVGPQVGASE